jgi:hypothetical protein
MVMSQLETTDTDIRPFYRASKGPGDPLFSSQNGNTLKLPVFERKIRENKDAAHFRDK